ncbi:MULTISPECIES: glutamine--fructose-6-phosphate transaminase (isomerizing) [Halolamina]|uniref:Glutamine--fructose-6-phosphate aminotransferase [isomerizing] n=1 Tax=Halolamina pelagica TaxID=699431 RepID=A0A1I5UYE4_9EURY|nr:MULTISPECIES: glutamine--fructose-6-phosphate transaminase (isomerizing) [Halolamina]NHX36821.1 glutamine--fructose-6-phosphate transaminase (isomerizing) [Halolamina sp. R1-12]SFQ00239.1 glucosamine--fructose-6-phosphate aminotransferase (isomerizing) [Halolamina pelagica]
MCGIIGAVGRGDATLDVLLEGLSNLEYRGYDSAGVAVSGGELSVAKRSGELDVLEKALAGKSLPGTVGIGHTRWSTHGAPTDENAHPHMDCTGTVAVVHNGIIENYESIKTELMDAGHEFKSETDTEVVPHLIEAQRAEGASFETAFRKAVGRLEGSYAIAAVLEGSDTVYAARNDSPLVLGVADDATYLGSDVPAFLEFTDRVVYLEDGEVAELTSDGWAVSTLAGESVEKDVRTVDWESEETGKSGYDHYMLKEIHEQPRALRQCLQERVDELSGTVDLGDDIATAVQNAESIQLVACGTSYHAALYAAELFRSQGVPAQAFVASEYVTSPPPHDDDTLVIGVTQSGETADTLSALRDAQRRGVDTLAVTNVVGSTASRECDGVLYIRSGPEIGVAATKTFSAQVLAVNMVAAVMGNGDTSHEFVSALRDLPGQVQTVLDETNAREVAERFVDSDAYFFIGRGYDYPVAMEGALKMKEISYKHAEGFPAGELKHGPLALVTGNTPVFAVVTGETGSEKTVGNVKEVEARNAPVVAVTDGRTDVERYADEVLEVPETDPRLAPVLANVQLQLVSYHVAKKLGRSIDKPRNLAKSVTVE